jgi:hypothetical protein
MRIAGQDFEDHIGIDRNARRRLAGAVHPGSLRGAHLDPRTQGAGEVAHGDRRLVRV